MQERAKLSEELEKKTLLTIQTIENESQTDDSEHEKLAKINNELNCALQTFKDKIQRVVTERPELFDGVAEETDERLVHLISTLENQATQVNVLKAQRDQIEEQLQNGTKELQR
jgi:prephenate dehydrogenase